MDMITVNQNNVKENHDIFTSKREKLLIICPICYSEDLKVRTNRGNKKCYYCKTCEKYTQHPIKLDQNNKNIELVCYHCHSNQLVCNGISSNGKKVYFCTNCNKHSIKTIVVERYLKRVESIACGNCQSSKLKKRGFNSLGKQVYYCYDCQKRSVKMIITNSYTLVNVNSHS